MQKVERKMHKEDRKQREELINIEKQRNAELIVFHAFAKNMKAELDRELRTAQASKRDTTHSFSMPQRTPLSLSARDRDFMRDSLSAVRPISNPKS